MRILFAFCVCVLIRCARGSNYDAYLADLHLRNQKLHDVFRRTYPSGAYVLDYVLTSPDFREVHPVLREYNSGEEYDGADNDDSWHSLLNTLAFAEETARNPDTEVAAKRLKSWLSEQYQQSMAAVNGTPVRAKVYPAYPGSEFAPQDTSWGTHRVSGGSSEVGRWMDYAVFGAQAQEDDEDEYDSLLDDDEKVGYESSSRSDVKLDKLPTYCDPPNPCPVGYDPASLATPCDEDVSNTAEFNRNWIVQKMESGECSCDEEHMAACPRLLRQRESMENLHKRQYEKAWQDDNPYLRGQKRSDVVAKKNYHGYKPKLQVHMNPYFRGDRLQSIVKKSGPRF